MEETIEAQTGIPRKLQKQMRRSLLREKTQDRSLSRSIEGCGQERHKK